jgi:hypothetical protein
MLEAARDGRPSGHLVHHGDGVACDVACSS